MVADKVRDAHLLSTIAVRRLAMLIVEGTGRVLRSMSRQLEKILSIELAARDPQSYPRLIPPHIQNAGTSGHRDI
uniref:Uncharacterized protein n=1 Tax=Parascaris equorum TaxID=6256 RepID=A0A914RH72_PAREQ